LRGRKVKGPRKENGPLASERFFPKDGGRKKYYLGGGEGGGEERGKCRYQFAPTAGNECVPEKKAK